MNPPTREWQMPGLPEIEAFQVAMAEAGYHRAVLNGRGDGFLFDRDEDRWFGWRLARAAPKAPPMPEMFDPSASHIPPDYRDGWNDAIKAMRAAIDAAIRNTASRSGESP